MQLGNGSRVVIIGGGPAGSCTALHLPEYSRQVGLRLDVTIFEARDFNHPGPGGCNKCAGILSSSVVRHLQTLGLHIPPDVVQAELEAYVLHFGADVLNVERPDPTRQILSVYRGSGPRLCDPPYPRSFDGWLLDQAIERGATVRHARVQTVRTGAHPIVATPHEQMEADLVVLATGVNSRPPLDQAWGYRPPRTVTMAQNEMRWPGDTMDAVHIFFDHPQGLLFGGLIPKGRYASISLLGQRLSRDAVGDFLNGNGIMQTFPAFNGLLCGCAPRAAISPAAGIYADRFVATGDAAVTRLYKDGIGAAFVTSEAAARTAIMLGISSADFANGYRPVFQRIANDNRFGLLLFRLWDVLHQTPWLLDLWRRTLAGEVRLDPTKRIHTRSLWSMFTGDESYRRIFFRVTSVAALRGFLRNLPRKERGSSS